MAHFVLEIEGKPIIVFSTDNQREAEETVQSDAIAEDLLCLLHDGRPLWNGESDLHVREAHPEEVSVWDGSFARARRDGDAVDEDRKDWATFLIDVVDATADADEEP